MAFSENSFKCHLCPQKGGDGGCPMWWEVMYTNITTQEEQLVKGCGYTHMPRFFMEVIKASNRGAASTESMRNTVHEEVQRGLNAIGKVLSVAAERNLLQIENG